MKKILLLCASFLFASGAAMAYDGMEISHKDGSKTIFNLHDKIEMQFSETHLTIKGADKEIEISRDEIASFRHCELAGVGSVNDAELTFSFSGDNLSIHGLPDGAMAELYTPDGLKLPGRNTSGDCTFNLSGNDKGIYIVVVNDKSFKIRIR